MKSATIPLLIKQIELRKMRKEWVARGLAAREETEKTGQYFTQEQSLAALDAILDKYAE